MTYKEFASQINIKVDNPPNDCDMSREITIEDCIYLFNSLGRQIRYLQERNRWHTGTPTEEGEYICWTIFPKDICRDPEGSWKCKWKNGKWFDAQIDDNLSMDSMGVEVIAWQKIEPYKEN